MTSPDLDNMITLIKRAAIAAGVLALTAGIALAQGSPRWQWGWWFWLFPAVRLAFVLGCIAAFVFLFVRTPRRPSESRSGAGLGILKVTAVMAQAVLAHNLTRVMNIVGIKPLTAALAA
jgi:hypothetical protein